MIWRSESAPPTWGELARAALDRAEMFDDRSVHGEAYLAHANAVLDGWNGDRARALLADVRARIRQPGGLGLGEAWDAFQDGSVNPSDTVYTVTVTDHVGFVLLAAHRAGVDVRDDIDVLLDALRTVPLVPGVEPGACVAYSAHPNDRVHCVHNVSAGAAAFVDEASDLGFDVGELGASVEPVLVHERDAFLPDEANWPYMAGDERRSDLAHRSYLADSMLQLDPELGNVVTDAVVAARTSTLADVIGVARSLRHRCDAAGRGRRAEVATSLEDPGHTRRSLAQLALWVALIAQACD